MSKIITEAVLVPNQNYYRSECSFFFSVETIEKLFYNFLSYTISEESNIVESWIVKDKADKSYTLGFDYPLGTWMATYKQ